jgi:hypothetical protein
MAIANITGNILTDSGVATSSLLPLSGGTLTGALSGTSATFSSSVTAIQGIFTYADTSYNAGIKVKNTTNSVGAQSRIDILNNADNPLVLIKNASSVNSGSAFIGTGSTETLNLGVNYQNDLTILNGGAATFSSGIGISGATATTGGIQFPISEVNVNNANNLDDYEEGSFTPVVVGSSSAGTATYSAQNGRYVKIGRAVNFNLYCDWSAGTGTGNLHIGGLPYVADSAGIYPACAIGETSNITLSANGIMTARVQISNSVIFISQYPAGGGTTSSVSYDDAGYVVLAGTYYV